MQRDRNTNEVGENNKKRPAIKKARASQKLEVGDEGEASPGLGGGYAVQKRRGSFPLVVEDVEPVDDLRNPSVHSARIILFFLLSV